MGKEYDEKDGEIEGCCCTDMWAKEFKKEFKMAMLKKKEKILEAKLEFVREMLNLMKKSSMEPK